MANVGNDEPTTVDSDVQYDFRPAKMGSLTKPAYEGQIGLGLTMMVLHPTTYLVQTGPGRN